MVETKKELDAIVEAYLDKKVNVAVRGYVGRIFLIGITCTMVGLAFGVIIGLGIALLVSV